MFGILVLLVIIIIALSVIAITVKSTSEDFDWHDKIVISILGLIIGVSGFMLYYINKSGFNQTVTELINYLITSPFLSFKNYSLLVNLINHYKDTYLLNHDYYLSFYDFSNEKLRNTYISERDTSGQNQFKYSEDVLKQMNQKYAIVYAFLKGYEFVNSVNNKLDPDKNLHYSFAENLNGKGTSLTAGVAEVLMGDSLQHCLLVSCGSNATKIALYKKDNDRVEQLGVYSTFPTDKVSVSTLTYGDTTFDTNNTTNINKYSLLATQLTQTKSHPEYQLCKKNVFLCITGPIRDNILNGKALDKFDGKQLDYNNVVKQLKEFLINDLQDLNDFKDFRDILTEKHIELPVEQKGNGMTLSREEEAVFESYALKGLVESQKNHKCIGVFSIGGSSSQYSTIVGEDITSAGSLGGDMLSGKNIILGVDDKTMNGIVTELNKSMNSIEPGNIPVIGLKSGFIKLISELKLKDGKDKLSNHLLTVKPIIS